MASIDQVVNAVLYEGYVLWPYRRSTMKNQQRWTFGGVYPRAYSEANGGHDPWLTQTQCLASGADPVVSVRVRFLQVVDRQVHRVDEWGGYQPVDELTIGSERYLSWEEAVEREVSLSAVPLSELSAPRRVTIEIPPGSERDPILYESGAEHGFIERRWGPIEARADVSAEPVGPELFRLTVRIENTSGSAGQDRDAAIRHSLISTHTILTVTDGAFLSLMDPPAEHMDAAKACENIKTWPVLVGDEGDTGTMLSSPIILYDYPQIAPESPGDLYDSTEIDQLLVLNVLSLTDDEKAEMRASDPRAREILERTESLTADDFMNLHGATREFRMLGKEWDFPTLTEEPQRPHWYDELEAPPPEWVTVNGVLVEKGSRVVLRPKPGGDVFDLTLAGMTAIVEGVEGDYDGRVFLAVTVEDDPGRELGQEKMIGHRFFFTPDEVEPISSPRQEGPI